jgi:hypothetical protein
LGASLNRSNLTLWLPWGKKFAPGFDFLKKFVLSEKLPAVYTARWQILFLHNARIGTWH